MTAERKKFNEQFAAMMKEADEEAEARKVTDAVILGRISMLWQAQLALEVGADLEKFVMAFRDVVAQEVIAGAVDDNTFEIPENFANGNDGQAGI